MRNCSVFGCTNGCKDKKMGISMHTFPKDEVLRRQWIAAVRREHWAPKPTSCLCSVHFHPSNIDRSGYIIRLKPGSVPMLSNIMTNSSGVTGVLSSQTNFSSSHVLNGLQSPISKEFSLCPINPNNSNSNMQSSLQVPIARELLPCPTVPNTSNNNVPSFLPVPTTMKLSPCPEVTNTSNSSMTSLLDTPRKKKMKYELGKCHEKISKQHFKIRKMQQVVRRKKKQVANLKTIIQKLRDTSKIMEEQIEQLSFIDVAQKDLINRQFAKKNGKPVPKTYSPNLKKFAITLNFYSPKAYEYVRSTYNTCLPHSKTISRWYQSVDCQPGFTKESFNAVMLKSANAKYPLVCSLMIDEISIRKLLERHAGVELGYVNIGNNLEGDQVPLATEILVFMLVAINDSWKIPVGYFPSNGISGDQKRTLLQQCLTLLSDSNIKVASLTCDGAPSNIAMMKHLGCEINSKKLKTTFLHGDKSIAFCLDACHMLKLVRNTLGEKKVLIDPNGNEIKWEYIEKLHHLQENEGLHLGNRLRKSHIEFEKQKMKVRLAAQLFSESVADAIEYCNEKLHLKEFGNSSATTQFIRRFNYLFDLLNSRNILHPGFKKPLCDANNFFIFDFIDSMETYINGLRLTSGQLIIESNRKIGFLGFKTCMQSLKSLFYKYVSCDEPLLKYIPMYKLSQDHLELFFSAIRSRGGYNNNPTVRQFRAAYKKLLIHAEVTDSKTGNCIPLDQIKILNSPSTAITMMNNSCSRSRLIDDENCVITQEIEAYPDYLELICLSDFVEEAVVYIAGYTVKYIQKRLHCETCISALYGSKTTLQNSLIYKKSYGGLTYPSKDVIDVCTKCEKVFRGALGRNVLMNPKVTLQYLVNKVLNMFIGTNFFPSLVTHMFSQSAIENHAVLLIKAIATKYLDIRLHYLAKQSASNDVKVRQYLTKTILFKHQ